AVGPQVRDHALHDLPDGIRRAHHHRCPVPGTGFQLGLSLAGRGVLRRPHGLGALRLSPENWILMGVAVVAIAAAVAAFAIAWRRSGSDWRGAVSSETRTADRTPPLDLPPVPVVTEPEPEPVLDEPEPPGDEEVDREPVAVAVA